MQLTPRHRLTSKTAFILFIVFQTTFLSSYSQIDFEKGKNLFQKSEFDSAFAYFSKLIDSCGNACADSTLAIYKVYMGKTYTILEQYDKALAEFENAIQLMNSANSYNGKSFAMISLAEMYRKSYKLEKARLTLREVFDLHKKHSLLKSNEAYMYNRFAAVLNEQENFNEEVVLYSNKVLEITQETEDFDMMASSINELGYFEEKQKSYEKAMQYYLKAFEIYKKQDSKIYIAQMLTNLARISLYDGKEKLTEEYLKQGIQLTENTTWYDTRSSLLALYSSFLYDRGRWRESREILEQYIEAQVAKLKKQHSRALVEMESKYEFSKKTAIIEMEQQKSELAKAELYCCRRCCSFVFADASFSIVSQNKKNKRSIIFSFIR
jgi:tetratricopeptide (TPR) repeat protein